MDKAPASGAGDSEFESRAGHLLSKMFLFPTGENFCPKRPNGSGNFLVLLHVQTLSLITRLLPGVWNSRAIILGPLGYELNTLTTAPLCC